MFPIKLYFYGALALIVLSLGIYGGYKLRANIVPASTVPIVENVKQTTVIQGKNVSQDQKDTSTDLVKHQQEDVKDTSHSVVDNSRKTIVREFDPKTKVVVKETVVEEKTTTANQKNVDSVKKIDNTVATRTEKKTTVETVAKIVDKKEDSIKVPDSQGLMSGIKVFGAMDDKFQTDLGVAKELVKIPDNTPIVGGIAGNVYLTVLHPSLGIAFSKPILPNVEGFIGVGTDLTQASTMLQGKVDTRGVIGIGLKLQF